MQRDPLPDLSIVIVNRNTRELLEACLGSIYAIPDRVTREVVVVDNGSTDGSVEMVNTAFPQVSLIRNSTNTGFAFPNNQGMAVSRGRYLLLLNSDTAVRPGALDRLIAFMDAHPEAGACGPRLLYPDGRLQRSCFSFDTPWRYFCDMLDLGKVFPHSRLFADQRIWFDHSSTATVDWLMGAALVVRRSVLETVGGLDERFRIHCNESDWCYRIHRAGWAIYYVPESEIIHHCGETRRVENDRLQLQGEMLQNLFDYYQKHFGRRGVIWFRIWTVVGFTTRRMKYRLQHRLRPTEATRALAALSEGMVRAGWTGNPNQFDRKKP